MKNSQNHIFVNLLLVVSAAVCFALANPNFVFPEGLPFFAWIMYVPVFLLVHRSSKKSSVFWGMLCGMLSYLLYVSWLVTFSFVAAVGIILQYGITYALLFLVLKFTCSLCKKYSWLGMFLVLCSYEYIKTLGFLGFSYGVSAYTQWKNIYLLQSSNLFGVWSLSFLIDFSSALIYKLICKFTFSISNAHSPLQCFSTGLRESIVSIAFFFILILLFYSYGFYSLHTQEREGKSIKVCAVQHNTDPWIGGLPAYQDDIKRLINLTEDALQKDSDIALVAWPETAVVPSILSHYAKRFDRERFNLINSVLTYIESKQAVFVIGNFHSVDNGTPYSDDYNSAFVFTPKKNVIPPNPEIYNKVHLVPFTEVVPFGKKLSFLYEALLHADTHLWSQGTERNVFSACGISFATPICFEDTFGNDCRKFVKNGARAFVNMSNDAWSKSLACQNQHLAMAIFRSVENQVPTLRSTASGQTCIIDIDGKILEQAPPFTESYVTGYLPSCGKNAGNTLYDKLGDFLAIFFVIFTLAFLFIHIFLYIRPIR